MKVLFVFGTRPEAVKMAPLIHAMRDDRRFEPRVCVTGQHRQMLDQFLKLFEIKPDHDLDIMTQGQDLFDVMQRSLIGLRSVLKLEKPDLVMVQGDTATTHAGAMAAFYMQIPVGHIEAGLRTYDLAAPWPEEGNRQMTSRIARFHFAPTERSAQNLVDENISKEWITVTGNSVIDALFWMKRRNDQRCDWADKFASLGDPATLPKPLIVVTGHRRENFGSGFKEICRSLATLAEAHPDWSFVYPVHLNPNVSDPVNDVLGCFKNIHLIEPQEYDAFTYLMDQATLILTDSGGVQEEAPSLGKPVLVMRETTERPEAVDAGTVILVGTNHDRIVSEIEDLVSNKQRYETMARTHNPYGDGKSSARVLETLANHKN